MEGQTNYVRTRKETADLLRISLRTLQRMEARGELPARIKLSDRRFGYRENDIAAFIEARMGQ